MEHFNIETTSLFDTFKELKNQGCIFQYFNDDSFNGRTITLNDKELLHFASCSYLALEKHPKLIQGSIEAIKKYGTQTPSSRAMLSSPLYREAEELLKQIFPGYHIITQTVTLAHCGVLPLIIDENDAIILDAYAHNSIRMASQLCQARGTFTLISKHNDMDHVKYLIYRLKKEGKRNIWYCADGIYSIHGDFCDIPGLHKLLNEEHNFYAYIDDAHGTGWTGKNGTGYVIGQHGLHNKMIVIESFAKSLVSSGGAVVVPEKILAELIHLTGQTLIFSGPLQPALLGSLIECLKLHLSDEIVHYQNELKNLILYFRQKSYELDLPIVTKDISPIQLLRIADKHKTYELLVKLKDAGYITMPAIYPAIAEGDEGIRITITRHLTQEDISGFLMTLKNMV